MINVLVSGVGSVMGYGMLRSLKQSRPDIRLIGTDISPVAVGQVWCDHFEVAPPTATHNYLDWLLGVVAAENIDLILPGFDQDVQRLLECEDKLKTVGCTVALNEPLLVRLSADKWEMYRYLVARGLSCAIPSALSGTFESLTEVFGRPFLLKPRSGYGSKGILTINSQDEFDGHKNRLGEVYLAQRIVGTADQEFSVGVFGDGRGDVSASITLKRTLGPDGATSRAGSVFEPTLDAVVSELVDLFRPIGPTNLQFRRGEEGWKLLEINPRVSSSASIRALLGYNEAQMAVEYYLEGRLPAQPLISRGFVARYLEDVVLDARHNF